MGLGTLSNIVGLIGIIPLVWAGRQLILRQLHARKLLRFGLRRRLDVVVTTSAFARSPGGTSRSYKTNLGEVLGLASIAGALGRYYPRKPLDIHVSERIRRNLDSDLVVLGGPLFNKCAADFTECFNQLYPTARVELKAPERSLRVGTGYQVTGYDMGAAGGLPTRDLALILIGRNPFAASRGVGIYCAGMTTYGTAAAADYLFSTLVKKREGREVRRLLRNNRGAAIVLATRIVDQQHTHVLAQHLESFAAADRPTTPAGTVGGRT